MANAADERAKFPRRMRYIDSERSGGGGGFYKKDAVCEAAEAGALLGRWEREARQGEEQIEIVSDCVIDLTDVRDDGKVALYRGVRSAHGFSELFFVVVEQSDNGGWKIICADGSKDNARDAFEGWGA